MLSTLLEQATGRQYGLAPWLALDMETQRADHSKVVMAAWQVGRAYGAIGPIRSYYGDLAGYPPFWRTLEQLKARGGFIIAQNAKFEAHRLAEYGLDPTEYVWFDTMLAEWVLLGNVRKPLSLDALAARYGEAGKERGVALGLEAGVCPSEMPQHKLVARCKRDVRTTAAIAMKQIPLLAERGLLACAAQRNLVMPVLCQIERGGICLDKGRVHTTYYEYLNRHIDLQAKFAKLTGGINQRSTAQLAHYLYGGGLIEQKDAEGKLVMVPNPAPSLKLPEKTSGHGQRAKPRRRKATKQFPEGLPLTDKNTLAWLQSRAKTKKQLEFFTLKTELGQVAAALSKNLQFFKGVVDERDGGIFKAEIRQATTATHRLSGRGLPQEFTQFPDGPKSVQPHNMPRAFKRLQKARHPDYVVTPADAAQLEFRVAAFLGNDAVAIADIRNPDFDAHIQTAAVMHDVPYADLLARYRSGDAEAKQWRQDAKPNTYKPLYGGEKGTELEERYYRWFREHYRGISDTQAEWMAAVESSGKLRTCTGLTFTWDFEAVTRGDNVVLLDKGTGKPIKPSVCNFPVQYLATGEIVLIAVVALYRRVRAAGLRVIFTNTVHDSVDAEVHKDDLEAYESLVIQAFTHDVYEYLDKVYGIKFNVPLGVEIVAGEFLGEGKSKKVDVEPPAVS